jgi:hypothetical protein
LSLTGPYRWRLYVRCGRNQLRLGVWRRRADRVASEYRWIGFENHLVHTPIIVRAPARESLDRARRVNRRMGVR